jgi:hypothetical protein
MSTCSSTGSFGRCANYARDYTAPERAIPRDSIVQVASVAWSLYFGVSRISAEVAPDTVELVVKSGDDDSR